MNADEGEEKCGYLCLVESVCCIRALWMKEKPEDKFYRYKYNNETLKKPPKDTAAEERRLSFRPCGHDAFEGPAFHLA